MKRRWEIFLDDAFLIKQRARQSGEETLAYRHPQTHQNHDFF